jgi:hypothetical protein
LIFLQLELIKDCNKNEIYSSSFWFGWTYGLLPWAWLACSVLSPWRRSPITIITGTVVVRVVGIIVVGIVGPVIMFHRWGWCSWSRPRFWFRPGLWIGTTTTPWLTEIKRN